MGAVAPCTCTLGRDCPLHAHTWGPLPRAHAHLSANTPCTSTLCNCMRGMDFNTVLQDVGPNMGSLCRGMLVQAMANIQLHALYIVSPFLSVPCGPCKSGTCPITVRESMPMHMAECLRLIATTLATTCLSNIVLRSSEVLAHVCSCKAC